MIHYRAFVLLPYNKAPLTFLKMEEYLGKCLRIQTEAGCFEGKMHSIDAENGKIILEGSNRHHELKFNEITNVSLLEQETEALPLKETDMHLLFYEAFNMFGPFEDQFIYTIACALKKFFKDITTASIKIIVGSDDIFGKIGLCFARIILNRARSVTVELRCELHTLDALKYKNAFVNSGGYFSHPPAEGSFAMILFAANRHSNFELATCTSSQIILLDIPKSIGLQNFIGLGIGFVPENLTTCNRFYYLIDVGFGDVLAKKYKLPRCFKNSLMKIEVHK